MGGRVHGYGLGIYWTLIPTKGWPKFLGIIPIRPVKNNTPLKACNPLASWDRRRINSHVYFVERLQCSKIYRLLGALRNSCLRETPCCLVAEHDFSGKTMYTFNHFSAGSLVVSLDDFDISPTHGFSKAIFMRSLLGSNRISSSYIQSNHLSTNPQDCPAPSTRRKDGLHDLSSENMFAVCLFGGFNYIWITKGLRNCPSFLQKKTSFAKQHVPSPKRSHV